MAADSRPDIPAFTGDQHNVGHACRHPVYWSRNPSQFCTSARDHRSDTEVEAVRGSFKFFPKMLCSLAFFVYIIA